MTYCNYDPSGEAPVIETTTNSTFLAFYSGLNTVGIRKAETTAAKLKVYPNPTRDRITVWAPYPLQRIVVSNMMGQQVLQLLGNLNQNVQLDLSLLPGGVYLITAEGAFGRLNSRVVLQR